MQILALVCLAGFAGVVLYQLYAVLGKRVGRQPEDTTTEAPAPVMGAEPSRPLAIATDGAPLVGLAGLREKDPEFDPLTFLRGARTAYETIVKAFAANDRASLKSLTAPHVFESFATAISAREESGLSEEVEFLLPPRADLEAADVIGDVVRLKVRFLSEYRVTPKADAAAAAERRAAEVWTFERPAISRDPNWTLTQVEAAQA